MTKILPYKNKKHWTILFILLLLVTSVIILFWNNKLFWSKKADNRTTNKPLLYSVKKRKNVPGIMEYIYNAPESGNDTRYEYQWEILKTALEKTKTKYGSYLLSKSQFMSEKRQFFELKNSTDELTVMYLGTTQELERDLLPIRIPVDKNLGGYCILLIREDDQEKFEKIKTLEDLKKLSIGLGYGWIDVDILRSNNFNVVTGSTYEGLFKMLENKRFDAFSRSAVEILDEYENRKNELKDIKIEDSLLLYYPLPMYFWFSKTEKGKLLARRAKEGMEIMISDGTYEKIFLRYHGYKTEKLNLKGRRFFKIDNPFLVPETPFNDKQLWYDPINK
jgi:ABC-type amino acid transport substrate-binding protein